MTQKINDTSNRISHGGRLEDYWIDRPVKQRRSSFVEWDKKDIDMKALLEEYKLKGFEFGRYLNNEDRYDFLIAAKDSLSDLAWLIKTDNIGIEYEIGIAFGARGRGGHAVAHFEPGYNMINLTKTKGASSLAHEYGHALDYVIGLHIDQNKKYAALSAGRSMAKFPEDNTGGTVRLLMRKLIREIKMTQSFARLKDASDYWHYNTEVFARFFEQWCCYTMRAAKKSNSFLTYSWSAYIHDEAYLTEADFKKVLPTGNKLIKNIGLVLNGKKPEAFMDLEVVNPEKVKKAAKPAKAKKAAAPKKTATKAADPKTATNKAPKKGASTKTAYQDYDKAFKALTKFTKKDELRPMLASVYHAGGDMVATDAFILAVIHNAKYPKDKEGKMILARKVTYEKDKKKITGEPGQVLPGKFPNYNPVLPKERDLDKGTVIVIDDELAEAKKHVENERRQKEFVPYQFKKFYVNAGYLIKCLAFMKAAGAKTVLYHDNMSPTKRAGVFRSGNLEALIMPVMKD